MTSEIPQILNSSIQNMWSESELLQRRQKIEIAQTSAKLSYFEIIRNKTASFLASSCAAGAYAASQDETKAELLRQFGEKVGLHSRSRMTCSTSWQ